MDATPQTDNEQTALWNGHAGRAWVDAQALLDQMFKPFEELLVEAVRAGSGHRVLDVGCGTGSTTLAVARLLGAGGRCVGADISDPMIAAARARAGREDTTASFIRADVQMHAFEPASFDTIISRLGVMFFDNPVAAFANLRRAARDDAELQFIAWRSAAENPFMTTAERAAAPLLPNLPARRPGVPGQFSFADRDRISTILEESGWAGIDIRPIDVDCTLPEKALAGYLSRFGPVGLILQDADERTRAQVGEAVRAASEPYVHGTEVRYTAACWMVSARAPSASAAPREAAHA
ncbi:class I SAM-dependent methyltransferase [Cupriavidus basilensis]|uniref:Class I SAM-dependent methyltransferase n=1 Tax=Cupriavidus basilensis TaxID=68895 RepID=A0ABT6AK34_9BURK|nr:class I SAM-dependent methyltransferase [Cupriavidus basilensis]MDF3832970.1 class I SAM-dependent methyltransferase [Cupriavidus basilensis]